MSQALLASLHTLSFLLLFCLLVLEHREFCLPLDAPRARRLILLDIGYGLAAIDEPLEKIPAVEAMEEAITVQASYSAVDLMGHVNNARYIDWISDCFTFDQHREQTPASIQINYINEVRPGEQVRIQRGAHPDRKARRRAVGLAAVAVAALAAAPPAAPASRPGPRSPTPRPERPGADGSPTSSCPCLSPCIDRRKRRARRTSATQQGRADV